jgi:hypothetical protein
MRIPHGGRAPAALRIRSRASRAAALCTDTSRAAAMRAALALLVLAIPCGSAHASDPAAPGGKAKVSGSLVVWGDVVVDFAGPATSEQDALNPFLDRRLTVSFVHVDSGQQRIVPGYFAADGSAADTGASAGTVWRAHLLPDLPGTWTYEALFDAGPAIAVSLDLSAGTPVGFDGTHGSFTVGPAPPDAQGFHADGLLRADGGRYLRFAGSGRPFVKTGTNSPENLLAFKDFDGTPASHAYAGHVADWLPGDPLWAASKGKGLIGAVNYLSSRGVNSTCALAFNVGGDGDDVWPWTSAAERLRFDVSKLEQWNRVFDHLDRRGVLLHLFTQETENDTGAAALDGGELGTQRKLYYRELVARFGHHLALQWNLGEENSNTTTQLLQFDAHLAALDAYDHPIAVHTFPTGKDGVYLPLLSASALEAASLQVLAADTAHAETLQWVTTSAAWGTPWAVCVDELGPPSDGVLPDAFDPLHDGVRRNALWGNLMAGGAGCEWYFGYAYPNDDLDCEDFRSRDAMWTQSRLAREFAEQQVPLDELEPADALVSAKSETGAPLPAWCLSQPGVIHALYVPQGGEPTLDVGTESATWDVRWYDPREGLPLQTGTIATVSGAGKLPLGLAPHHAADDWALLVRRIGNSPPKIVGQVADPTPFPGNADFNFFVTAADADGLADIAAVAVHFVTPSLDYVGYALAAPVGGGSYHVHVPDAPQLMPGKWIAVTIVSDKQGHIAWGLKTFTAL